MSYIEFNFAFLFYEISPTREISLINESLLYYKNCIFSIVTKRKVRANVSSYIVRY